MTTRFPSAFAVPKLKRQHRSILRVIHHSGIVKKIFPGWDTRYHGSLLSQPFVMCPEAKNFYSPFFLVDLVDQPVLHIDPSGIQA